MSILIKTEGLSRTYKSGSTLINAISDVNLSIEKGSCVGIIGPSGAGKSTLLHIMSGLEKPSKGRVFFNGRDLYRISDRERSNIRNKHVGFVFQFYNLMKEFSVIENIIMPSRIAGFNGEGKKKVITRAEMFLDRMNMLKRRNHNTQKLSGGEAQRVAIARALINDPEIVFCDEPTGNLDSEARKGIYVMLNSLREGLNMNIVLVTHDKPKEMTFDAVYKIRDGVCSKRQNTFETADILREVK